MQTSNFARTGKRQEVAPCYLVAICLYPPAWFKGRTYPGTVIYISSEAEFTPKNVQTSEERVKLVYAVKVRVTGDAGYDLKPGMPADVRLTLAK